MKLDLKSNTRMLRERLKTEKNALLRKNISTVIRHIESEIANDVDMTMSTLVAEPSIRSYFSSLAGRYEPNQGSQVREHESYMSVDGAVAVRRMYDMVCEKKLVWSHFDVHNLVVDTHCIVQSGLFHVPTTGAALKELGRSVDDEAAYYLGIGNFVVMFPFDEKSGLLLREDIYVDPATYQGAEKRKIKQGDYSPNYEKIVELAVE